MGMMKHRLLAIDWMRGVVMVLMAIDHASEAFNSGRLLTDSAFLYEAGTPLPAFQFFTRWITHICAPTFVFLAGTSLALSVERRIQAGRSPREIDRDLFIRGTIIALLDVFLITWLWIPGALVLQVLYAIGLSMIAMIPLRRLPTGWLLGLSVGFLVLSEMFTGMSLTLNDGEPTRIGSLFLHGGQFPRLSCGYPLLPWLAVMVLGWTFGRYLLRRPMEERSTWGRKTLWLGSAIALCVFLAVRGINHYGNMLLLREDGSLIQWLHVSKYPPAISFVASQLALMGIILGVLFLLGQRIGGKANPNNVILVLGQTALFFYVLHIPMLELAARALGVHARLGLGAAYSATVAVLVLLWPCCWWYRRYKQAHPNGWVRFI